MRKRLCGVGPCEVHHRAGAERAVVQDVRIGDRQDDARFARAQPAIQYILQKDHARPSIRIGLGAHAVIGGHHERRAQSIDLGQRPVDREVEPIGLNGPRRVLVLHVVAGREIHQIRLRRCQKVRAIGQRALAEPGGIDFDAARFDRQTGSAHAAAKQAAQLVLGGDDGHARACTREGGENRVGPEIRRVVHHHGVAGFTIEEEVSADAVNRRRHACDDRDVVGVREAWQRRLDEPEEPDAHERLQVRRDSGCDRSLDVLERRAVEADDHDGPQRPAVHAAVHREEACLHQRFGASAFAIFATTVKFGSTTFAISYSAACPIRICAPRSVMP